MPTLKPLSPDELSAALSRLEGWEVVTRQSAKGEPGTELHRSYRFSTFEDAMHFMLVASRYISKKDHHPDWRNSWVQVEVWLTTWDAGHQPSSRDEDLALYLDELYKSYAPTESK